MPVMTSELAQGYATGRTKTTGSTGITYTRVFKVLLSSPNEAWDIQNVCGVHIGDFYPSDDRVTATSFQDRADGESRVVRIVTFEYSDKAEAGDSASDQSPQYLPPDVRMANWSTSVSLMEVPCLLASRETAADVWEQPQSPTNPLGDLFEGITRLEPIMSITVEQWEACTPTRHMAHVGKINSVPIIFPPSQPTGCGVTPITMAIHTLMFEGLSHKASVESFGPITYRGWAATYSFKYRLNPACVNYLNGAKRTASIGWDMAVPSVGRNIFNAGLNVVGVDQESLHYEMNENRIIPNWGGRTLAAPNQRLPSLVTMTAPEGGLTQRVAASPVALNNDGTPRDVKHYKATNENPVLIYRTRVHEEGDLVSLLGLRLT